MRSVNQNHHLYVIKGENSVVSGNSNLTADGQIKAVLSGDTENPIEKDLYFLYKGRDGVTRSDFIPVNQISYIKYVSADSQKYYLKKFAVTLDPNIHTDEENNNTIKPIPGADYILNISFQQFYGLSPEDTYVKTVAVRATSRMSKKDFYEAMENELNASFSREIGADATSNPYLEFTSDQNGLYIAEKKQPWSLGKWESESLMFEVIPSTIYVDGVEMQWGVVNQETNTTNLTSVPNSERMADLEWFTFKERADIYGYMGYPNNFDFIPWINPSDANGYSALEIHFAYQGTCEDIQKSEKDITIVGSDANINSLVSALETLLSRTIKKPASVGEGDDSPDDDSSSNNS